MKRISLISKALAAFLAVVMVLQIVPMSVIASAAEEIETRKEIAGYSTSVSQDEEEAKILGEDINLRHENNIKYFKMSDGTTKAVVYTDLVHYKDENGAWQDIDNTLVSSDGQNGADDDLMNFDGFETKDNAIKVKFAKNSNQKKLVSMKIGNYSLSFSLLNNAKKNNTSMKQENKAKVEDLTVADKVSQKVYYENILPDTNIEYIIAGTGVKENIVVKEKQISYQYSFEIDVKNLILTLKDDGCIYANDIKTNENVFVLPKPFALDSNYEYSGDVNYSLDSKSAKKYVVNITADADWMNSSDRAFPVTIDPGIHTEQTRKAIVSTFVASGTNYASRVFSDSPMVTVGKESSGIGKCHGLLKFDLPEMNVGDVVIDAQLSALQVYADAYSSTTPDAPLEVHAVTSAWSKSSVCWNNKPSYDSNTVDFEVLKRSECGNSHYTRNWNVTSIVKRWYDGSLTNNGLLLRSSIETASTYNESCIYAHFYGEGYSQSSGYPMITITFRSNKGLESYWSYTDLSVGRAGTASICEFSGNLVFTHGDTTTPGNRAPASISHVFNNYMANEGFGTVMPYRGHGWMLSCQQQLLPSAQFGLNSEAQATYPYVYIDGDGTEHYFYKKSDGTMIDEDGMGLTLTVPKTNNNNYYKITDDKGNIIWFNVAGAFARSLDNNGNQIANYYASAQDPKIWKVTDGAGNIVNISPTQDNLAVQSITDPAGRVTTFNWSSGRLLSITYPDSKTTTFTYDSDGSMTSVTAPDGYKLQFTYTPLANGKRVSRVVESANGVSGQTITFDYSQYGETVIRSSGKDSVFGNSDDIYTTIKFDSAGRTVCSESTSNGKSLASSAAEYTASKPNSNASNIKQLNRLSKSITGGQYIRNYLRDGNSDISGTWAKAQWNGTAEYDGFVTGLQQLYGRWSYYINSKSFSDRAGARAYQTLTSGKFKAGTTYTFSAWVKTENIVARDSSNPFGAQLMATYWLPDSSTVDTFSEALLGTTDSSINNGWQRLSVTFTVPSNATQIRCNIMIRDAYGNAWFDGMQLEEGASASQFNMVNNSSFERYTKTADNTYLPEDWSGYLTDDNDSVNNLHSKDSGHSFLFRSLPKVEENMSQYFYLGGTTAENLDDTYILSGWVYANPVGGNNENNKICLAAKVFYSDDTDCITYFNYNSSVSGWQYIIGAFTLRYSENKNIAKTPTGIKIYIMNYKQSNYTWFDNIQLVRDEAPSYTYDSNGNLVSVKANAEQNSSMEYTNNNLTKTVDAKGFNYTYEYDAKHNMTQATSQGGTKYCYQYDSNGNPTSLTVKKTDDLIINTGVSYTEDGQFASSVTDQDGYSEQYQYENGTGHLSSYTNKSGINTTYRYKANSDLLTHVTVNLSDGTRRGVGYTYDDSDRLKQIRANTEYNFAYDDFGNVVETSIGFFEPYTTLCTNTYGPNNGDLKRVTYGNGDYIDYTYDDYGNIISQSNNGQERFKWNYDSTGNIYSHEDLANNQKYLYTYDSIGRLIRQSATTLNSNTSRLFTAEYGYDLNNNVTKFTALSGGVSMTEQFSYGTDNLALSYTYPNGVTASYSYDNLLRRTGTVVNASSPLNISYAYMSSARNSDNETLYTTTKVELETIGDTTYKYEYDVSGNITKISKKTTGESSYTAVQQFAYDDLNQLVRADDLVKNCTEVYIYDRGGNITSVKTYPLTWGSLDGVSAINTSGYCYDNMWSDELTFYNPGYDPDNDDIYDNGYDIIYDAIGNPLLYMGYDLTWQNGRQLATLSGNGITASYTYDVDGLRTSKTVNGVKHEYYYVGSRLQYEKYGDTELWFFYDADGNPSGIRYKNNGTVNDYYFVCNWRGDVIKIYDSTGSLVANYDYDAWGKVVSVTDANGAAITSSTHIANINPIRYRGYYYDSETGIYYLKSRYYDPLTKRFVNGDTVVSVNNNVKANNIYTYCFNNPVIYDDQTGCYTGWDDVAAALVGGSVSVFTQAVLDITSGSFGTPEAYIGTFVGGAFGGWISLYYPGISGAVSGGASELIKDLLENYTGKANREMDEIMINALSEATKGLIVDFVFEGLPTAFGDRYRYASSKSSDALKKVGSSNTFSGKRNAFYNYFANALSASSMTALPQAAVNTILLLGKTIDCIMLI